MGDISEVDAADQQADEEHRSAHGEGPAMGDASVDAGEPAPETPLCRDLPFGDAGGLETPTGAEGAAASFPGSAVTEGRGSDLPASGEDSDIIASLAVPAAAD